MRCVPVLRFPPSISQDIDARRSYMDGNRKEFRVAGNRPGLRFPVLEGIETSAVWLLAQDEVLSTRQALAFRTVSRSRATLQDGT